MLRLANVNDLKSLLNLYTHLHETNIPILNNINTKIWNKILSDSNYNIIVFEVNNKIVSSCSCIIIPNLTRNFRPYALIENVVTHKEFRTRGYGLKCLNYAKEIAIKNNCYKIMLMSSSKDKNTLNFYKKAGYNDTEKTGFIQRL